MDHIDKNEIRAPYKIVIEGGEGEIVEKKSRFIATVQPVESEEEAVAFVDSMKKSTGMPDIIVVPLLSEAGMNLPDAVMMANPVERPVVLCWKYCWGRK